MFSKEEQALAKPTVEAIKKIAERQEKECPECKGRGGRVKDYPGVHCPKCDGIGRIKGKWEWEPEVGEFYLLYGKLHLVSDPLIARERFIKVWGKVGAQPTPLLHWEKIEEILEGMGYYFTRGEEVEQAKDVLYIKKQGLDNLRLNIEIDFRDKSRQLAVMRAVIKLGKEVTK